VDCYSEQVQVERNDQSEKRSYENNKSLTQPSICFQFIFACIIFSGISFDSGYRLYGRGLPWSEVYSIHHFSLTLILRTVHLDNSRTTAFQIRDRGRISALYHTYELLIHRVKLPVAMMYCGRAPSEPETTAITVSAFVSRSVYKYKAYILRLDSGFTLHCLQPQAHHGLRWTARYIYISPEVSIISGSKSII
jgi:hypothetical protein